MDKRKRLTYPTQKIILKAKKAEDFMNARNSFENFFPVTKIELVLFVTRKLTAKRMEDRKNHGLVYYEKPYGKLTFGDKIITP